MRYAGFHCRKTWLKIKMENHCGLKFLLEQNGVELAFFSPVAAVLGVAVMWRHLDRGRFAEQQEPLLWFYPEPAPLPAS